MSKFTMASVKSFVRKNKATLKIKVGSTFDGMIDGVSYNRAATFAPVVETEQHIKNTLGIQGAWFVGSSRDMIDPVEVDGKIVGFKCYNCCGSFEVMA